jgi:hypothetical protein
MLTSKDFETKQEPPKLYMIYRNVIGSKTRFEPTGYSFDEMNTAVKILTQLKKRNPMVKYQVKINDDAGTVLAATVR